MRRLCGVKHCSNLSGPLTAFIHSRGAETCARFAARKARRPDPAGTAERVRPGTSSNRQNASRSHRVRVRLENLPTRRSLNSKRFRASAKIARFRSSSDQVEMEIPRGILESVHVWTCKKYGGIRRRVLQHRLLLSLPKTCSSTYHSQKIGPDTPHPDLTGWEPEDTTKTGVFPGLDSFGPERKLLSS